jgi:hypothetical protein
MSRKQNTSGVWKFLEMSGVLDAGSNEDIANKRKEYWNLRKRMSKQEKRRKETEFKIYLNDDELQVLSKAAKKLSLSRTRYIKQAAMAYTNKEYLTLDQAAINHIRQLLSLNYFSLQELSENASSDVANVILQRMADLEEQILTALNNPQEKSF